MLPADFRVRFLTGSALAGFFLLLLILASLTCFGNWLLGGICLALILIACAEFSAFSKRPGQNPCLTIFYFLCPALPSLGVAFVLWRHGICAGTPLEVKDFSSILALFLTSLALVFGCIITMGRESLEASSRVASELLPATLLLGIGGASALVCVLGLGGLSAFIWLIAIVCMNDTSAYLAGTRFGGVKLAAKISPGKTVVGAVAGLCGGIAVGVLLGLALGIPGSVSGICLLSACVTLAAQGADLVKSYLKRLNLVKDSSSLLPGHGGIFDRIDGLLGGGVVLGLWYFSHLY